MGDFMPKPFLPDQSSFFRPFDEEWDLVPTIGRQAKRIAAPSFVDALFLAWCQVRDNDDAAIRVLTGGVVEFRQRFGRALEDTQTGIQSLLDKYLVDGLVNLVGWLAGEGSHLLRRVQTGLIQNGALNNNPTSGTSTHSTAPINTRMPPSFPT